MLGPRQQQFPLLWLFVLLCHFVVAQCRFNFITAARSIPAKYGVERTQFDMSAARNGKLLVTNLDDFRQLFVIARHMSLRQTSQHMREMLARQRKNGKLQLRVPPYQHFFCNLTDARSAEPPISVHQLRPGDIDVIASMGDSLSAGNGIISENVLHILNEYRGLTFSGGGYRSWREFLTLPNIIKVFNPQLYGFSIADGLVVDRSSRLNIAEPMIMSRDLSFQVRVLIERMRHDAHINMQQHWKLLTIFVGNNDVCSDMCHHDNKLDFLRRHEQDLRQAFTLLRDNVPRLVVNLVPVPNMVTSLLPLHNLPMLCNAIHRVGCHCIFSELIKGQQLRDIEELITRWQEVDAHVASLPEFQTEEFSVIYQPFLEHPHTPTLPNGDADLRYFASDCFHFSQRGHAALATSLWNNMLQPIGAKESKLYLEFEDFHCPTPHRPYIATWLNSLESN